MAEQRCDGADFDGYGSGVVAGAVAVDDDGGGVAVAAGVYGQDDCGC